MASAELGTIGEVVVAGGGIAGWSAAAALKRHLPRLTVTIIPADPPPDALTERIASTLPSILAFHRDIGLGLEDTILRAGSGLRLGTQFEAWAEGRTPYVHAYGEHGVNLGAVSFHHHWVAAGQRGAAPSFDSLSPAAAIARAGLFTPPHDDPTSPLGSFEYGLVLNLPRYRAMIRAYGQHLGVIERAGPIAGVRMGENGFIAAVRLGDGSEVAGHLFVDCTGPAALLRRQMDETFEDWSRWLRCDRILFAETAPPPEPAALDIVTAVAGGWTWQAPSPVRTSHGLVYSSAHLSDGEARRTLRLASNAEPSGPSVSMAQGRWHRPWLRNCVAIGDAAVSVEPLEWTNLHLTHSAIDRIISMMPGRDCNEIELVEYNRQSEAEADRVRDFILLHYVASHRTAQPFWQEAAAVEPPASLAHTLALFRERGRLPFYEEETFTRDSWLSVLFGQGVVPRRADPMAAATPSAKADEAMERMHASIAALLPQLPTQKAYLTTLARQVAR